MSISQARQNFHEESEAGINRQINLELHSSYFYLSLATYYDRDDVALLGFYKFFRKHSDEKRCHAEKLMEYQNKRGGRIVLQIVQKPEKNEWGTGLEGMQSAFVLEKNINQSMIDLCKLADDHGDEHMSDFIEDEFLHYHVEKIKEMSDFITQLKNVGPGLGEFEFDKKLQEM